MSMVTKGLTHVKVVASVEWQARRHLGQTRQQSSARDRLQRQGETHYNPRNVTA